jgi:hypothetical protein
MEKTLILLVSLIVLPMLISGVYASTSVWIAPAYTNSGSVPELFGLQITTKKAVTLVSFSQKTGATATSCYIYDNASTPTLLKIQLLVGDVCTVNYALANNSVYNLLFGDNSSSYTKKQLYPLGAYTLPDTTNPNINIIQRAGCIWGSVCNDITQWDMSTNALENIANITTDDNEKSPTSTSLFLNGVQNNLSISYGTSLNMTALSNVTGLYVSLYKNNTLIVNTTSKAEDNTVWPVGYYNITALTNGNSSFNPSSQTFYANVSIGTQSISLTGITNNTYPYSVTPICSGNVTSNLYRNNAIETNNSAIQLGVGTYTWICNTTTNANYTFNSATATQVVSQATQSLTLSNNVSWTGTYPYDVLITGNNNQTQAVLYRNDTNVSNPNAIRLDAGSYVYIFNTTGNANYSANTTTNTLTIAKGTPTLNLTFNTSDSVLQGTPVIINCAGTDPSLWNDTGSMSNPFSLNTTLLNGTFNYSCNNTDLANYTYLNVNKTLTITLPIPLANVTNMTFSYCSNNDTLYVHDAEYISGILNYSDKYTICPTGCSNTTLSCNPSNLIQNVEIIFVVCVFAAFIIILAWRVSK